MNHDIVIKTTNRVAIYATVALIYWVFAFLVITVFNLKIFRERMTETFFLSLLGIFAVLGGAIILNVMSNLSKISGSVSRAQKEETSNGRSKPWRLVIVALSFPAIAAALFAGNELSQQRKKDILIGAAERLVSENRAYLAHLASYEFSREYLRKAGRTLDVLNKIDKHFPEVMVIASDTIDGKQVFLGFAGRDYAFDRNDRIEKRSYIYSTTQTERDYLDKVFGGSERSSRFHAEKGNYQLYFPTAINGKLLVLYFSDYQRYGKYGS